MGWWIGGSYTLVWHSDGAYGHRKFDSFDAARAAFDGIREGDSRAVFRWGRLACLAWFSDETWLRNIVKYAATVGEDKYRLAYRWDEKWHTCGLATFAAAKAAFEARPATASAAVVTDGVVVFGWASNETWKTQVLAQCGLDDTKATG